MKGVPSIISADLSITGDLQSSGEIQIDGSVEGDIRCQSLVVGVNGSVSGEIEAESVRLHGKVCGQIRSKVVFLAATARMVGDITHESLAIEPGAFMEGLCKRMTAGSRNEIAKVPELKLAESFKASLPGADADLGDGEAKASEDKSLGAAAG